ncbi:MAG TPA: glutathione S-transferase [Usitatibacteraceae bacterium]
MQLIGMLDSPYVRRVAISMKLMDLPFEHRSVSVFRHYAEFEKINSLVKAPTLVCDDGQILIDSSLIIDYLETLVPAAKRLLPVNGVARRDALQRIGIALVACEKTVQHYYELNLRPAEKCHQPWLDRVAAQAHAAYDWLEPIAGAAKPWISGGTMGQDDVTLAVAWRFTQFNSPALIDPARYPALAAFSARAEARPEFIATPLD